MKNIYKLPAICLLCILFTSAQGQWVQQGPPLQLGAGGFGSVRQGQAYALSPDGNTAAISYQGDSGGVDMGLFVFQQNAGQWVQKQRIDMPWKNRSAFGYRQSPAIINSMAISSGGGVIAVSNDSGIIVYNYANGVWYPQASFLPNTAGGNECALSYSGDVLVCGSQVYIRTGGTWTVDTVLYPTNRPVYYPSNLDSTNTFSWISESAISADGNIIIISDSYDPDTNTSAWVFARNGNNWTQQTRLEGTGKKVGDIYFNSQGTVGAPFLSGDGNTLVLGLGAAFNGDSVWLFTRQNNTWQEQNIPGHMHNGGNVYDESYNTLVGINYNGTEIVKTGGTGAPFYRWTLNGNTWSTDNVPYGAWSSNYFDRVELSSNGYSGLQLDSAGETILLSDEEFENATGGAWVFTLQGDTFKQVGNRLSGTGTVGYCPSGALAMSADGSTIAASDYFYNGGNGAVWIYTRQGSQWTQLGPMISPDSGIYTNRHFGYSVTLSADGSILAVGAPNNNDTITNAGNPEPPIPGSVYVFQRNGQTYVPMGDTITIADAYNLGTHLYLSGDGQTLLICGAYNSYIYGWNSSAWTQQATLLATTDGWLTASLSGDGLTAVAGDGYYDNMKGEAIIYARSGNSWQQTDVLYGPENFQGEGFANQVVLSYTGSTLVVTDPTYNSYIGQIWTYNLLGGYVENGPDSVITNLSTFYGDGGVALSGTGDTLAAFVGESGQANLAEVDIFGSDQYGNWSNIGIAFGGTGEGNGQVIPGNILGLGYPLLPVSSDMNYIACLGVVPDKPSNTQVIVYHPSLIGGGNFEIQPATCTGVANGQITTDFYGPTPPYKYSWSNGGPNNYMLSNLLPGDYTLTVTDLTGDTLVRTYYVPANYTFSAYAYPLTSDCSAGTGSGTIRLFGGGLPFSSVWNTNPAQYADTATHLTAGTYTFTATDSVGCSYSDSIAITSNISAIVNAGETFCNVGGWATVTVYGTPPYTYSWSNGETTDSLTTPTGGSFTVIVTDSGGCTASATVFINDYCNSLISGRVFFDRNNNCVQDASEPGTPNLTIIATQGPLTSYGTTDSAGNYQIIVPDTGSYTISIAYWQECSYPVCTGGIYPIMVNVPNQPDTINSVNIELVNPGIDLTLQASGSSPYPGSTFGYSVYYGNLQDSVIANGAVTITYDSRLTFDSTLPAYTSIDTVNHIITFDVTNIGLLYPLVNDVSAWFTVPRAVLPKTALLMQSSISSNTTDCNLENNAIQVPIYVAGSLDPNYKSAYPENILPEGDSLITYTIHFQNVGNDSTHFITVLDTLQPGLDPASVTTLATSHLPFTFNISKAGILNWTFNPISLPDSASNPIASQGYVTFQVKTKGSLPPGAQLNNTASVYFDYNAPVVTNTVTDTIDTIAQPSYIAPVWGIGDNISIYPNPANNLLYIRTNLHAEAIIIYDVNGQMVAKQPFTPEIDIHNLIPGVYLLEVTALEGVARKRWVKM